MSMHIFGMILTNEGIYANNRGNTEGNTNTLQKVIKNGQQYSTVSSEAIRYAVREYWQMIDEGIVNRKAINHSKVEITDKTFENWPKYIDDDVLGFMKAQQETISRRGLLEITRAISIKPWYGEIMSNYASPGSNPSVKHMNPIPYSGEVHNTRYQYGFVITPAFLGCKAEYEENNKKINWVEKLNINAKKERLKQTLEAIINIRRVGGNHSRYLTDFSPDVIILRYTDDPAPRFLYCFEENEVGQISISSLISKIDSGDISAKEIVIGTSSGYEFLKPLVENKEVEKTGVKDSICKIMDRIKDDHLKLSKEK